MQIPVLKVPVAAAVAAVLLGSTGYCAFNQQPDQPVVTTAPPTDLLKTQPTPGQGLY